MNTFCSGERSSTRVVLESQGTKYDDMQRHQTRHRSSSGWLILKLYHMGLHQAGSYLEHKSAAFFVDHPTSAAGLAMRQHSHIRACARQRTPRIPAAAKRRVLKAKNRRELCLEERNLNARSNINLNDVPLLERLIAILPLCSHPSP